MKLVVCVKTTPDTTAIIKIESGKATWGAAPLIINPWDEYAVEAALKMKETNGGMVTAVAVGGEDARLGLIHALAMGVDDALLVSDPILDAIDQQGIAYILFGTIKKLGGVDMAFFGRQGIDDDCGTTPAQVARLLGWPALTLASKINWDGNNLRVERSMEEGRQIVTAKLPAVVSLVKDYGEPRPPPPMSIRRRSKVEIPTWSLSQVGVPAPSVVVEQIALMENPIQEEVCELITGDNPQEIAENLVAKILGERLF